MKSTGQMPTILGPGRTSSPVYQGLPRTGLPFPAPALTQGGAKMGALTRGPSRLGWPPQPARREHGSRTRCLSNL